MLSKFFEIWQDEKFKFKLWVLYLKIKHLKYTTTANETIFFPVAYYKTNILLSELISKDNQEVHKR